MSETNVIEKPSPQFERELPFVRGFERPDIDRHAAWFIPRLLKTYSHLNDRSAMTWLLNILYSPEFKFLFLDHGVALAQAVPSGLRTEAIIEEQFVWVDDPEDKEKLIDASYCYEHFYEWAKRKALTTLIVGECSDVPVEMIRARLGKRLFERKLMFAKVDPQR